MNITILGKANAVPSGSIIRNNNQSMSVFAGARDGSSTDNIIEQKRNMARNQVKKLIKDAWDKDAKESDNIQRLKDLYEEKKQGIAEKKGKISDIEEKQANLQSEYGVEDDSQEQKDLELLLKYQNNKKFVQSDSFSEEELTRLKELQDTPLTKYQQHVLYLNDEKDTMLQDIEQDKAKLLMTQQTLTDSKIDMLKTNDMGNAQDAAETIMQAVNEDVVGALFAEGKEHIDEQEESREEQAEEAEKEAAEREERLEEKREEREQQEEIIEGEIAMERMESSMVDSEDSVDHMQQAQVRVQKLMKENHMLNEDLKGIEIDFGF